VRHVEALNALKRIVFPSRLRLVHVSTSDPVRHTRRAGREELAGAELDSTEVQVATVLRDEADLVVDGATALPALVDNVVRWLRQS
jgi:hypothetical protein